MKKRFLSIVLILSMMMCLVPITAFAEGETVKDVSTEQELVDALADSTVDVITLKSDIAVSSTLIVKRTVTLDIYGYMLEISGNGSVIKVADGGHLTLEDSDPKALYMFTPDANGLWKLVASGGTKAVRGGVIYGGTGLTDRNNNGYGGGVYVDGGGQFTMTSGNIVGCKAEGYIAFGGGVFVAKGGQFTMTGGRIVGCTAVADEYGHAYGGGICNDGEWQGDVGRTTLSGTAEIRHCHAKGGFLLYGGGISDAGTLTISGDVKIIGCTAGGMGSDAMDVNANNDSSITGGTFYGSIEDPGNKINGLTVTYHLNNDKNYATQVLQSGDQITLTDPAKLGYAFDGWYKDGAKWEKTTLVTENLTLTGWLYVPVTNEMELKAALADDTVDVIRLTGDIDISASLTLLRKVTLDLNGHVLKMTGSGSVIILHADRNSTTTGDLTLIDSDPTAEHKFKVNGVEPWVLDEQNGKETVKGGVITGGTGTPCYLNGSSYFVARGGGVYLEGDGRFTMNGGNIVGCIANTGGGVCISENGLFTMNGGSIVGCSSWDLSGPGGTPYFGGVFLYSGTFTMTGGVIKACAKYSVDLLENATMNANGGEIYGVVEVGKNSSVTCLDGLTGVTAFRDIFLIRHNSARVDWGLFYGGIINYYSDPIIGPTVTYMNGETIYARQILPTGTPATRPDDPATTLGYTFGGWNKADGTAWDYASDKVTGDITLYAKWIANTYTITFDTAGGSEVAPITQDYNTQITAPANPTREGYTFIGWDKEIPQTMPAENITITAQWKINQYTIKFDTAGGSEVAPITQDYNTQITAPANPTREGYAFNGWDKEIPQTMPAENITITAQWKDTEKPTGEISVGTSKWNTFLNNITFGLFFNETQTVTVTASDNSGDDVKIEYLLSAKELTEAELANATFTVYTAPFDIDPDNEYIIYVKLTDKSNNIAYISSQGIVLDGTSPVISGIENGKTYCEAQTVTVIEKYVDTVTVNGKSVTLDENNQFVISPADGEQRIVVTDKVGNMASAAVTVNNGHTASEDDGDCTTPVKCIYHNDVIVIPAKQHDFSGEWHKDENEHWHSCQNSGCTISEAKAAHSGNDDNDCTTPVVCECGYVLTAARPEHTWGEWVSDGNGKHTHKCTADSCTAAEAKDCGGGTATCHTKAVCDVCHNEYGEYKADNHDGTLEWIQTATTHEKKWSCCKAVATAKENHSWENGICTECGYGCAHSGGTATCHTKAVCDACHSEYGEYNADNHDGGTKVSGDIKAGCTQKGYTGDTYCLGCEKILTKGTEIAASGHSGGNATCRDKAKCDVCGKSYGELNPKNHADLKHINAKAATTDAEGNIEYWYCDGCDKYFSDAAAAKEISKADTVIKKIQSYPKSPQTGYCTNLIQLWLALLFVGGGVVTGTTVIIKRRYNR